MAECSSAAVADNPKLSSEAVHATSCQLVTCLDLHRRRLCKPRTVQHQWQARGVQCRKTAGDHSEHLAGRNTAKRRDELARCSKRQRVHPRRDRRIRTRGYAYPCPLQSIEGSRHRALAGEGNAVRCRQLCRRATNVSRSLAHRRLRHCALLAHLRRQSECGPTDDQSHRAADETAAIPNGRERASWPGGSPTGQEQTSRGSLYTYRRKVIGRYAAGMRRNSSPQ